jgi:hypothetical protein
MFSIVKTALAAVIVLGSVSLVAAPAFAAKRHHAAPAQPSFESRDVSLPRTSGSNWAEEQWFDRATQSFGAG